MRLPAPPQRPGSGRRRHCLEQSRCVAPFQRRAPLAQRPAGIHSAGRSRQRCARLGRARIPFWITSHRGRRRKKIKKGKRKKKKKNKSQTTNTTNTARSFHIWSFSSWPWHNLQASCWSRCVCASFIRQSASLWKQHQDLSTGKDPPLATDQNRHRAGFFLHAWRDLVNKIASEDANDKFKKNVICPKY